MYIFLIVIVLLGLATLFVLRLPVFGRLPSGARLDRIRALPNADDRGEISNLSPTPVKPEEAGYTDILKAMLKGNPRAKPSFTLPHRKPGLNTLTGTSVTWFGHSSYLIQTEGIRILADPVFSARTSPFSFIGNRRYAGTDFFSAADFPEIDVLVITHDHYDHMDYRTILQLRGRVKHFLTSLGAGAHLERWGIAAEQITELAWGEAAVLCGLTFTAAPARHFTGRLLKRNHTLWSSFVLQTQAHRLFLGGDSGYDTHFADIGAQYGPFDLAILECGQYNALWPYIHMFPEQTAQAARDLRADWLLPVHWGKFTLALHDWDEPVRRLLSCAPELGQQVATPYPGETFFLGGACPSAQWWINDPRAKQ